MSGELGGNLVSIKVSGNPTSLAEAVLEWVTDLEWQLENEAYRVVDLDTDPVLEQYDGSTNWNEIPYESVDRLSGKFTFSGDGHGTNAEPIRVKSGNYLPMTVAAYAHAYSYNRAVELHEVPRFLDTYKRRIHGTKFASGSLSQWDVKDTYYETALIAGKPVVLEIKATTDGDPQRVWAILENEELSAALDSPQDLAVSFVSTGKLLNL